MKLVLIRHGESVWNKENLFTGWTDVELSSKGIEEAKAAGVTLNKEGYDFDVCFTSYLKRAIHTQNFVLEALDREWLPVYKSWKLNERHYGALQGLNKAETAEKYGLDQVNLWRRSFDVNPPNLKEDDERSPKLLPQYRAENQKDLPLSESLKDTIDRVVPYFEETIKPLMSDGKRLLITAHGNSLRSLVMYLDHLSPEEIAVVNIPTGVPLVYELDDNFSVLDKYYLGDQSTIDAKIQSVANQANKK